jgi:Beta protein
MYEEFKYMPVLRLKEEEKKLLGSFNFGNAIFPCVEIFKEFERQTEKSLNKSFSETYIPLLSAINSRKVFVDLPVHLEPNNKMKDEVLDFVSKVLGSRENRTAHMLQLSAMADKIIPVISTYSQRRGSMELNSIITQEGDLRPKFNFIAFRTFEKTIGSDILQIKTVAQPQDFLIVDLEENPADPSDPYAIQTVIESLGDFDNCKIIILASAIPHNLSNTKLLHGELIPRGDNRLLLNYAQLGGHCFGDYAGIKKGEVTEGGSISPGFIFYDPVENAYYGYKGSERKKGEKGNLADFQKIIVPAVYNSPTADRMQASDLTYLTTQNIGWTILAKIHLEGEPGGSQGKFKRISMEHYLHGIRVKIAAGQFNA